MIALYDTTSLSESSLVRLSSSSCIGNTLVDALEEKAENIRTKYRCFHSHSRISGKTNRELYKNIIDSVA